MTHFCTSGSKGALKMLSRVIVDLNIIYLKNCLNLKLANCMFSVCDAYLNVSYRSDDSSDIYNNLQYTLFYRTFLIYRRLKFPAALSTRPPVQASIPVQASTRPPVRYFRLFVPAT